MHIYIYIYIHTCKRRVVDDGLGDAADADLVADRLVLLCVT